MRGIFLCPRREAHGVGADTEMSWPLPRSPPGGGGPVPDRRRWAGWPTVARQGRLGPAVPVPLPAAYTMTYGASAR